MDWQTVILTTGAWVAAAVTTLGAVTIAENRREKVERQKYLEAVLTEYVAMTGNSAMNQYVLKTAPNHYSTAEATTVGARVLELQAAINLAMPELSDEARRLFDAAVDLFEGKENAAVVERGAEFAEYRAAKDELMSKGARLIEAETARRWWHRS